MSFWKLPSKYIIAGVLTNALAYSVYSLFIYLNTFANPVTAFQVSSITLIPVSFYLNRVWVFESASPTFLEFVKFTLIYSLSIIAGSVLLKLLTSQISNPYLAQFLSMSLIGGSTFLIHWLWTFKRR